MRLTCWLPTATALILLAACQPQSERNQCIKRAMQAIPLQSGVAMFTDGNGGLDHISGSLTDWIRQQSQLPAASLTKPMIAAEFSRLIETGRVELRTTVPEVLSLATGTYDPHLDHVTVRHLLQHTAGLDRSQSGDPLWLENGNPDCSTAAARLLSGPLDYPPGQRVIYSNAGYCLLGEILKRHSHTLSNSMKHTLDSGLGAAGGWTSSLKALHEQLYATLPIRPLAPMARLPDGSYYTFGWRYWPIDHRPGAPWTHTGRLPRMLSIALTDGTTELLVAHFKGDPADWEAASLKFNREAWQCMAATRKTSIPTLGTP